MNAVRIHQFGSPAVMRFEELPMPQPGSGEALVKVFAAGVGPWDTWIRAGRSALPQPLPLTLGSDLAGRIESVGEGVATLHPGQRVFGVTNAQFTGAYAQFAVAKAVMLASMPAGISFVEAAALPVVSVTAWQMLVEHAHVRSGQSVLILGAGGSVGSLAVQFAHQLRAKVVAVIARGDPQRMQCLGADQVIVDRPGALDGLTSQMDAVIDTVGGILQTSAIATLKPQGRLISAVSNPDKSLLDSRGASGKFILVDVNVNALSRIGELFEAGKLALELGSVLPLEDAWMAHEMLEGMRSKLSGKVVLNVEET